MLTRLRESLKCGKKLKVVSSGEKMPNKLESIIMLIVLVVATAYCYLVGAVLYALAWVDYPIRSALMLFIGEPLPKIPSFYNEYTSFL